MVETARGPVDPARLGRTLMHEHVFVLNPEMLVNATPEWDEDAAVEQAVGELAALYDTGVHTIADPTVLGLGRDVRRVLRVAERVPVQIIAATGIYTYNDVPFYWRLRLPDAGGRDPMTELFVRDITEGIGGTAVKAAFLKCAIDTDGMTPGVERVMRAVAAAHRETGVPVTVHTDVHNEGGRLAQDLLRSEGVDLTRVVIGHSGDSTDLDYLRRLLDAGSILGMDRFGIDVLLPFEQRVATVAALCEQGYAGQLVLAHDAACVIDWFSPERRKQRSPRWHFTHISDDVLPALRAAGVTDEQIDTMLVANPRRYFS